MAIKKQEFYEGAALHLLARKGSITSILYNPSLSVVTEEVLLLLKYSTKGRSPWAFTFTTDEQRLLQGSSEMKMVIGLVCGADGVASLTYSQFMEIAATRTSSVHIACYR